MAVSAVSNRPDFTTLFRRRVLTNLNYWQEFVANHSTDLAVLDSERERIVTAISFALELKGAWPDVYQLINSFSPHIERRGLWKIWNQLLHQALDVAQNLDDLASAITLSTLLARLLQRQRQTQQAIWYYRRTIRLARQMGHDFEKARACTNLGYLYAEQGNFYRAEVLCCHALIIFEKIESEHGCAHTENHLGFSYARQGRWEQARYYLERACSRWQAMGDNHGLMRGFINLGLLYNELEAPTQALDYLKKALYLAQLTGETLDTGTIYMNMSNSYRLNDDLSQAETYAQQAAAIFRRFSNSIGLAWIWINLGATYLEQKKWPEAKSHLETALNICRGLHDKYGEIKALTSMIDYDIATGNSHQANIHLDELIQRLNQYNHAKNDPHIQRLLKKHRRSLNSQTTAV